LKQIAGAVVRNCQAQEVPAPSCKSGRARDIVVWGNETHAAQTPVKVTEGVRERAAPGTLRRPRLVFLRLALYFIEAIAAPRWEIGFRSHYFFTGVTMQVVEWVISVLRSLPLAGRSLARRFRRSWSIAPLPGEWSALECLLHLVDAERSVFPVKWMRSG
jgi:hypothetical protein